MRSERARVNVWDLGDYGALSPRPGPAALAVATGAGGFAMDVAAGDGRVASALSRRLRG